MDKALGVVPLGEADIVALEGLVMCGVAYDSDISIDVDAGFGSLKGSTLGITAFEITAIISDPDGNLPLMTVSLMSASNVQTVCGGVSTQ